MKKLLLRKAKAIPWIRLGKWRTPLLMDAICGEGWGKAHLAPLGYVKGHKNFLMLDGEYLVDRREYESSKKFLQYAWDRKGVSFLKKFYALSLVAKNESMAASKRIKRIDAPSLSVPTLIGVFKKWVHLIQAPAHLNTFFIALDEVIEEAAKKYLAHALSKSKKQFDLNLLLAELTPPRRLAYVIEEEDNLFVLASEILKDRKVSKIFQVSTPTKIYAYLKKLEPALFAKLTAHRNEYAWLAVTDWWGPLFDYEYYIERIKDALTQNPQRLLKKRISTRRSKEKTIKKRL